MDKPKRPPAPLPDPYSYKVWREQQIRFQRRTAFIDRILTILLGARKVKRKAEIPPPYNKLAEQYRREWKAYYGKPYVSDVKKPTAPKSQPTMKTLR